MFCSVPFDEVNTANTLIKYPLNVIQSKCVMSMHSLNPHRNPIISTIIIIISIL